MNMINILNTCFILCLAISILFFIISVVLFFLFDIRTIFNIRSGRAQAKTVKEMQEANSTTGRLRVGKQTQTSKLSPQTKSSPAAPKPAEQEQMATTEQLTNNTPAQADFSEQSNETQVLVQNYAETSVLSPGMTNSAESDKTESVPSIRFEVIKKVICRDTSEVIR